MTHVVTQSCCNDATCVAVCPVNCIHPTPDEPGFGTTEMLYVDPGGCIDCGACVEACPVKAIQPDYELPPEFLPFVELNALYFEEPAHRGYSTEQVQEPARVVVGAPGGPLRVAIVGSGPAACYAAEELLSHRGVDVEVSMFEKLPTPWGLVRHGVAPDHGDTKLAADMFARTARRKGFTLHLNVEVGRDLSHEALLAHHHAVIYAVGAQSDATLDVPGEGLPGSHSATEFVGWYNGHPDYSHLQFDLSAERAVVIGNGNVALDVARILCSRPERLHATDIAPHALDALTESAVREVVVVGRRGPRQAAFTTAELLGLGHVADVDVVAEPIDPELTSPGGVQPWDLDPALADYKASMFQAIRQRATGASRRIVFRFLLSPVSILGSGRVQGVRLARNELVVDQRGRLTARTTAEIEDLECGLLLRSVGSRGTAVPGLPFDQSAGIVPNEAGRVFDPETGDALVGSYVAGWIKRGASGVIGTNRGCSQETVRSVLDDHVAGRLERPTQDVESLSALLGTMRVVDLAGWRRLDAYERAEGRLQGRPRLKLVDPGRMLDIAASQSAGR